MPRKIERKAFLFYASTLDTLMEFPPERQRKIAMALINYGLEDYYDFGEFSGALSTLQPLERIAFRSVVREINVQRRRYHNKKLIQGAIETIQNVISKSPNLDKEIKETYIDIIDILEEKYKLITKYDSISLPEELYATLPNEIYSLFHKRYEIKLWRDQINEVLETLLINEKRPISDEGKKIILDRLVKEYVEKGTIASNLYQDFINQYFNDLCEEK